MRTGGQSKLWGISEGTNQLGFSWREDPGRVCLLSHAEGTEGAKDFKFGNSRVDWRTMEGPEFHSGITDNQTGHRTES